MNLAARNMSTAEAEQRIISRRAAIRNFADRSKEAFITPAQQKYAGELARMPWAEFVKEGKRVPVFDGRDWKDLPGQIRILSSEPREIEQWFEIFVETMTASARALLGLVAPAYDIWGMGRH